MKNRVGMALAGILAFLIVLSLSAFTVDQRQRAIIFQLGEIKDLIEEPGLHFKWPLIQNVRTFDTRILTWDDPEPQRFITVENKPVLVDAFVKWRIVDVKKYYVSVAGDEIAAARRINSISCLSFDNRSISSDCRTSTISSGALTPVRARLRTSFRTSVILRSHGE